MKRLSLLLAAAAVNLLAAPPEDPWKAARVNGEIVDDIFRRTQKMMHAPASPSTCCVQQATIHDRYLSRANGVARLPSQPVAAFVP